MKCKVGSWAQIRYEMTSNPSSLIQTSEEAAPVYVHPISTRPIFFGVHPVKAVTSEGLRLVVEVHAISNAINLGVIVVSQRYRKGTKEEI